MDSNKAGFGSIDEYIASFPPDIQARLEAMRATIRAAAPDAEEKISYQMPTFFLKGNLVHFAAFKQHIGFYPAPRGIEEFKEELVDLQGRQRLRAVPFRPALAAGFGAPGSCASGWRRIWPPPRQRRARAKSDPAQKWRCSLSHRQA